ncbi:MAG: uracil-DNA glycosylase [Nitrososphaerota archaeon]|nr:uracil-DNA glycosylase [Nitrososphaerota archaeon]
MVRYRREAASRPPRRYAGERYWAKPLPGFGDRDARILVIGLAPAAHGGNRTGRIFTGDSSGDTLMRALHANRLSNRETSVDRNDGLALHDVYLTAAVRCVPPKNRPTGDEIKNCFDYLIHEFSLLTRIRVVVALGKIAFDAAVRLLKTCGYRCLNGPPKFSHSAIYEFESDSRVILLIASYHPSRQNTQTKRLTQEMLDDVFRRAVTLLDT